jgi:hypothetical protein
MILQRERAQVAVYKLHVLFLGWSPARQQFIFRGQKEFYDEMGTGGIHGRNEK